MNNTSYIFLIYGGKSASTSRLHVAPYLLSKCSNVRYMFTNFGHAGHGWLRLIIPSAPWSHLEWWDRTSFSTGHNHSCPICACTVDTWMNTHELARTKMIPRRFPLVDKQRRTDCDKRWVNILLSWLPSPWEKSPAQSRRKPQSSRV